MSSEHLDALPGRRPRPGWLAPLLLVLIAVVEGAASHQGNPAIEHAFGRTPVPERPPQRVVTLYQGATDTAVALGIEPVGVVDSWLEQPMYHYLREALQGVEHVGLETQPDLERIAWLDPDLIMATRFRHERVRPLLEHIAPTLATREVFDFKATLRLMAQATGREARARALLDDWDARVQRFRRQIAREMPAAWPQKAAVIRFKPDHVRLYSTGFAGSILDELGFQQPRSLDDQSWGIKLTSEENIPILQADVIFVLREPDDPAIQRNYRRWTEHPLWQQLDAVREGQVFEVEAVDWIMGGGIIAANRMLDDLFSHYDLPATGQGIDCPRPGDGMPRALSTC
ncbi:iron-siderophore ABC transporter substrate-binding protein [Halomonas sabkhae]|uniref:ABC transporter substrate-binding protein n=1 Tax=Halomonas sabkhae TaxID=626223 RepID=UPI0025B599C8|nr:iron-siderophore ABC transporter substrate-binding protein [Halomonas sabkhae]MDN3525858.1 iron-siderophore ABC transporter substrate-binding protein [Halomonas sabkhae]